MIGLLCWLLCRLFTRSCISAMDIRAAAQTAPTTVGRGYLVLVPLQAAGSPPKRRRLSVKVSVPSVLPPPPPPVPAILPSVDLPPPLWKDITEASFEEACLQRKYRVVYNRFQALFFWRLSSLGRITPLQLYAGDLELGSEGLQRSQSTTGELDSPVFLAKN